MISEMKSDLIGSGEDPFLQRCSGSPATELLGGAAAFHAVRTVADSGLQAAGGRPFEAFVDSATGVQLQ